MSQRERKGAGVRPTTRARIYERDGWRCVYCTSPVTPGEHGSASLDHVLAHELGGKQDASNLVTCCRHCNSSKKESNIRTFLRYLRMVVGADTAGMARRVRQAVRRQLPALAVARAAAQDRGWSPR